MNFSQPNPTEKCAKASLDKGQVVWTKTSCDDSSGKAFVCQTKQISEDIGESQNSHFKHKINRWTYISKFAISIFVIFQAFLWVKVQRSLLNGIIRIKLYIEVPNNLFYLKYKKNFRGHRRERISFEIRFLIIFNKYCSTVNTALCDQLWFRPKD